MTDDAPSNDQSLEILEKLKEAGSRMTRDDIRAQKVSFILGTGSRKSGITRDQVEAELDRARGEGDRIVILFELAGQTENHPVYRKLMIANSERHYGFLQSAVAAALEIDRPLLSQTLIKAINFHAIACLHANAGEYRPCRVEVGGKTFPPDHYRVPALMDDFVNVVNRRWDESNPIVLAAYVLWRLNHIHPFINGNGRTARAACFFVLCVKVGGWLGGHTILPELLDKNRSEYVAALQEVDKNQPQDVEGVSLTPVCNLIQCLLVRQFMPQ